MVGTFSQSPGQTSTPTPQAKAKAKAAPIPAWRGQNHQPAKTAEDKKKQPAADLPLRLLLPERWKKCNITQSALQDLLDEGEQPAGPFVVLVKDEKAALTLKTFAAVHELANEMEQAVAVVYPLAATSKMDKQPDTEMCERTWLTNVGLQRVAVMSLGRCLPARAPWHRSPSPATTRRRRHPPRERARRV